MRDRAARVITEVGAPWVVNVVVAVIVGAAAGAPWWGVFAAVIAGGGPIAGIWYLRRRGSVGDHHLTDRGQRRGVAVAIAVVMAAGVAVEAVAGAPKPILFTSVVGLVVIAVVAAVTIGGFKISVHTAVWAGSAVLLAAAVDRWWLLAVMAVPVVGWSRLVLRDHTLAQVLWGSVLGLAAAAAVWALMAPATG